jgi:transcriptional regulator with XRE-family HTH domain
MEKHPTLRTQAKLAARAGLAQKSVSRICRAEVDATIDSLAAIARALGVTLGTLVSPEPAGGGVAETSSEAVWRVAANFPFSTMTPMQLALAELFSKVVGPEGLTDSECLALLNTWSNRVSPPSR